MALSYDRAMNFAEAMREELRRRQRANPGYSLRAFARDLGISHSALSRLARGLGHVSQSTLKRVAKRLRWTPAMAAQVAVADAVDRVVLSIGRRTFVADARWIASQANLPLDAVQLAIHEGLRRRRFSMTSPQRWQVNVVRPSRRVARPGPRSSRTGRE